MIPPNPFASRFSLVVAVVIVTLLEGAGVYWGLRFYDDEGYVWAGLAVVAGEFLETAYVERRLRPIFASRVPIGDPWGVRPHRRRFRQRFGAATFAELAIWVAWVVLATEVGQWEAAAVLLVLMHLKHQLESTTVLDVGYFSGSWRVVFASIAEAGGAAGSLALILDGRPWEAAAALAAGLLIEHALLMHRLRRELGERDIGAPRPRRPPEPPKIRIANFLAKRGRAIWAALQRSSWVDPRLNRSAVNGLVAFVPARPNALSAMADYTSWASLTDRTWSGRHLPSAPTGARALPEVDLVADLFRRDGAFAPCPKSTVLFASFAQWFVDGFLRSQRNAAAGTRNLLQNESTHDVDLSQLYGFTCEATLALREMDGGRLKFQPIGGEKYPPYLCENGQRLPEFDALPEPLGFADMTDEQQNRLFAMGGDATSLGFTAFNVLFLREHNRIAGLLEKKYRWNDEQLFQTTRNILIVVLMQIVVEEYINHISGYYFRFRFPPPDTFRHSPWMRQNWMAMEFDLLYRWHSLLPPTLDVEDQKIPIRDTLGRTDVLVHAGLRGFMLDATAQRAGRISLFNTDDFLVDNAERPTIRQARNAKLRPYNDYRELCGLPRLTGFGQFSRDADVGRRLYELYGHPDNVEYYVGLFAEEYGRFEMLPPLMMTMVAFDAFSQILTSPLLGAQVYRPEAFTELGLEIIDDTHTLSRLIKRNVPDSDDGDRYSLTWSGYDGA